MLLFLMAAGFVASFIDSVVGGGGLISLPALFLTGMPPGLALGTNKLAAVMGSFTSTVSFIRSGNADTRMMKKLFFFSFAGSAAGVAVVTHVPSQFLKPLVVVLLVAVTLYTLFKKDWGAIESRPAPTSAVVILLSFAALIIGFYDGFFGPGTGSFLIFVFLWAGYDFLGAAANAKILNFASNLSAVAAFIWLGSVNYHYGIPMGLAMIAGAVAGSNMAIKKGAAFVRPLFIAVTTLLISKQLWDLFLK